MTAIRFLGDKILFKESTGNIGMEEECCCPCDCSAAPNVNWGSTCTKCSAYDFAPPSQWPAIQYDVSTSGTIHSSLTTAIQSLCPGATITCPSIVGSYVVSCDEALDSFFSGITKRASVRYCDYFDGATARTLMLVTDLSIMWNQYVKISSYLVQPTTANAGDASWNSTINSALSGIAFPPGTLLYGRGTHRFERTWYTGCSDSLGLTCYPAALGGSTAAGYPVYYRNWQKVLSGTCRASCNTEILAPGCDLSTAETEDVISNSTPTQGCWYTGAITASVVP